MYDDDGFDTGSARLKEVVKRIKQLRGQRWVNMKESIELGQLEHELDQLRSKCSHRWSVLLMFVRHRKFCKLCDKEDLTYKHQD
jgi:hypothetical protein